MLIRVGLLLLVGILRACVSESPEYPEPDIDTVVDVFVAHYDKGEFEEAADLFYYLSTSTPEQNAALRQRAIQHMTMIQEHLGSIADIRSSPNEAYMSIELRTIETKLRTIEPEYSMRAYYPRDALGERSFLIEFSKAGTGYVTMSFVLDGGRWNIWQLTVGPPDTWIDNDPWDLFIRDIWGDSDAEGVEKGED